MSNQSQYYFAENLISGFGKTRFLQVFHRAETSAGADLLGSVVARMGWIFGRYPSPFHMTKPQTVLQSIKRNRENLSISADDPIVQTTVLSGVNQALKIKRSHVYQANVSNIPNVPVEAQLAIDYERLVQFTFNFSAGARVEYIPTDYLARLYRWCDGKYKIAMPQEAIDVDDNYIVDQVLIAKNVAMQFASSEKFDGSFVAKVEHLNATVGATVKYSILDERTLGVNVVDGVDYLIGFKVIDWDDLG